MSRLKLLFKFFVELIQDVLVLYPCAPFFVRMAFVNEILYFRKGCVWSWGMRGVKGFFLVGGLGGSRTKEVGKGG